MWTAQARHSTNFMALTLAYALLEPVIGTHSNDGEVHGQRRRFGICTGKGSNDAFFLDGPFMKHAQ
ncbi:hypothetical protein CXB40_08415 [Pseudomonas syringae pv. avii]|nr:hypothetical protein CXB40_08415 [Pseudomonas syringae pv. avii]